MDVGASALELRSNIMRIATWNVNSVRQRVDHLLAYLKEAEPDVLCLQELKCLDDAFPRLEIESVGYNVATHGQKTFNGVAILSKRPVEVTRGLPGDDGDEQARYIEAIVPDGDSVVRVASIYLPNGNPPLTEKYSYKLAWMDRLIAHTRELLKLEESLVLAGDYNVIPEARDAADPRAWEGDALYLPATRERFIELINLCIKFGIGDF
jgi:exodeoxyribonuclease-3